MWYTWILMVIALTWQSADPSYTVEVQRKTGRSAWQVVTTAATGHGMDDTVGRGKHCWRVRHVPPGAPQTSKWTNQACIRVTQ